MPLTALAMVLAAALLHASWNLLLKRAQVQGYGFVWAISLAAFVLYAPLVLFWQAADIAQLSAAQWAAIIISAILHVLYFLSLQRGYALGDMSVVYPVARGTGPVLAALAAMVWFEETPSLAALIGLALIASGTFTIAGGAALLRTTWTVRMRNGLWWGAITGGFIACYTINDSYAVKYLLLTPLLLDWLANGLRAVLLMPAVIRQRQQTSATVRRLWRTILIVGAVSPLAYILVLEAVKLAPVSHVAPARELSMLFAAYLGARFLNEQEFARRLGGACLIAVGVAALVLAP
jgi:uncharacterized membrane protein